MARSSVVAMYILALFYLGGAAEFPRPSAAALGRVRRIRGAISSSSEDGAEKVFRKGAVTTQTEIARRLDSAGGFIQVCVGFVLLIRLLSMCNIHMPQ